MLGCTRNELILLRKLLIMWLHGKKDQWEREEILFLIDKIDAELR